MRKNPDICRRMLVFSLAGTMTAGLCMTAYAANAPGGGSQSSSFTLSSAMTELESDTYTDIVFEDSTTADEVAVRAGGANGIFSYGEAVVSVSDSTVTTTGNSSGGIMVAGGGTLYALNLQVTTDGGSSAAIRSDRRSGTMVVDQGIYVSNGSVGTGSPAIYCVADITAANATLVAKNAQVVCFEGRNPAWIYNCWLEGCYQASDDDGNSNVMIYQSQSGIADEIVYYGKASDEIYAGDWDGDGIDTLCVRCGNIYYFKNSLSSGIADQVISYGKAADEVLVGDWDGDGDNTLAVRRGNVYYIKDSVSSGDADSVIAYGKATDTVFAGRWK